jgi:predicted nucleic acid-binding protein
MKYVLDTSVIIKWFSYSQENDLEAAQRLRSQILTGECLVTIPDLVLYELSNALRNNPRFDSLDVKDAIKSLIDMDFLVRPAEQQVMEQAIDLAGRFDVTVYDAYFLALAESEKINLVTADYKFFDKVKDVSSVIRLDCLFK